MVIVNANVGEYLKVATIQDGDIAEIKNEGIYNELEYMGKKRTVLNILVEVNGKEIIWTPNEKHKKTLIDAWGNESKNWLYKKMQLFKVEGKLLVRPLI